MPECNRAHSYIGTHLCSALCLDTNHGSHKRPLDLYNLQQHHTTSDSTDMGWVEDYEFGLRFRTWGLDSGLGVKVEDLEQGLGVWVQDLGLGARTWG